MRREETTRAKIRRGMWRVAINAIELWIIVVDGVWRLLAVAIAVAVAGSVCLAFVLLKFFSSSFRSTLLLTVGNAITTFMMALLWGAFFLITSYVDTSRLPCISKNQSEGISDREITTTGPALWRRCVHWLAPPKGAHFVYRLRPCF